MQSLVGRDLTIEGIQYRVIEVRQIGHDTLVYAQPMVAVGAQSTPAAAGRAPHVGTYKAAFRLEDIAHAIADLEPVDAIGADPIGA